MKIKSLFPKWVHTCYMSYNTFGYDCKRVLKHCFGYNRNLECLKANLMLVLHTIEKGLTMPDARPGFGADKLKSVKKMVKSISAIESESYELFYTYNLLEEYLNFHKKTGYRLPEDSLVCISDVKSMITPPTHNSVNSLVKNIFSASQLHFTSADFFSARDKSFNEFAYSRHSCRNYTEKPIPREVFIKVAQIANQAPSSCNRQTCRMHVITEKNRITRVLQAQGGCRGFGHLASATIIVTSDLNGFFDVQERSQPAINSGFFGMNILYALHKEGIGACVLNWSNTRKRDNQLRSMIPTIKDSEQIEFLISCGYPPEEFDVALSQRRPVEDCISFVDNSDHEYDTISK